MPDETPEETPAAEAPAAEAAPQEAPAAPAAPLTPKERKAAARARRGRRRPATPEERAEARTAKAAARSRRRKQEREKKAGRAGGVKGEGTPKPEHGPGRPKTRMGTVTSDKADKTITVRIDVARRHRRYEKIVRSSTSLHAHDETNDARTGDRVRVVECRPMSATKRWKLEEVLERAK